MDSIDLIIPVMCTTKLPEEDQIRVIQSLISEKLVEFDCLNLSERPLYCIKIKCTLGKEKK